VGDASVTRRTGSPIFSTGTSLPSFAVVHVSLAIVMSSPARAGT
jgi:hypothetical protein